MPVSARVFCGCEKHLPISRTRFTRVSLLVITLVSWLIVYPCAPSYAQESGLGPGESLSTNPKSRENTVTATVVDSIAPSVPILVSPTDESTLITTLPTFIWNPSTDEQGILKYQLWLDGSLKFDGIPTGNTTNSDYTLVVEDGEMKLTVKASLTQGAHTWFIKVFDNNQNTAVSATWDFTIDSLAPTTTITQIGDQTTTITSADSNSVPATPYELNVNEPVIAGASETGATLQLSVTVPGEGTLNYTQIVSGGAYSFTLPTLPTNVVITFTLISTDPLGNASTISNVQFLIKSAVIIIPSETPGPTLAPGETPTPTATPFIEIEVPRPTEIIKILTTRPQIVQDIIDQFPFLETIIDNQVTEAIAQIAPVIALVGPPLITTAVVVQTTGSIFLPLFEFISKFLQAIGLLPKRKPRGLVYDTKNGKPVAFVTITITREGEVETADSVFSDQEGVYRSIKLPVGMYHLDAVHTEYTFPTAERRPFGASFYDFYKGEQFAVRSENDDQFFIIPVDPKDPTSKKYRQRLLLRTFTSSLRRFADNVFYPLAVFSFFITALFPTLWNLAISVFYIVAIILRLRSSRLEPPVVGHITDRHGAPVPDVIIRCIETQTNTLRGILFSDENGIFSINVPPNDYTFVLNKDNYLLDVTSGDYNNLYVKHDNKKMMVEVKMTTVTEMFPENTPVNTAT